MLKSFTNPNEEALINAARENNFQQLKEFCQRETYLCRFPLIMQILRIAVGNENLDMVKYLLDNVIKEPIHPGADGYIATLLLACKKGQVEIIKTLLNHGNAKKPDDVQFGVAFNIVLESGNREAIEYLSMHHLPAIINSLPNLLTMGKFDAVYFCLQNYEQQVSTRQLQDSFAALNRKTAEYQNSREALIKEMDNNLLKSINTNLTKINTNSLGTIDFFLKESDKMNAFIKALLNKRPNAHPFPEARTRRNDSFPNIENQINSTPRLYPLNTQSDLSSEEFTVISEPSSVPEVPSGPRPETPPLTWVESDLSDIDPAILRAFSSPNPISGTSSLTEDDFDFMENQSLEDEELDLDDEPLQEHQLERLKLLEEQLTKEGTLPKDIRDIVDITIAEFQEENRKSQPRKRR